MRPVELPVHVRPRLTSPIRVVFHIDTTRSGTEEVGLGTQELGSKRELGRRREQLGHVFWAESRVRRSGLDVRSGRIVSAGLDWAERVEPNRLGWTYANQRKMGRAREREGEWRRQGWVVERTPLAADGAGDGGEHRLGYITLGMGVTKLKTVRIEGNFEFFWLGGFELSARGISSLIAGNRRNWRKRDADERRREEEGGEDKRRKEGGGRKGKRRKEEGRMAERKKE
ncbi:hypothetical protein CRG98_048110 [Punica granatum]|uniref:Uncharacterized protein n=1 Tax=Punica granatum TaxID=22663 RepID=A0A2I0HJ29_PUNGR|nr:hypothetical protein CRG98_048110 [Punica granatum]